MQPVKESTSEARTEIRCMICGLGMYATDYGNYEVTYHCSSPEARFWDFDRGTVEQAKAKDHWDQSRQEIFLNRSYGGRWEPGDICAAEACGPEIAAGK